MAKLMSKSELIEKLTGNSGGLSKKNVKGVLEGLADIAYRSSRNLEHFSFLASRSSS